MKKGSQISFTFQSLLSQFSYTKLIYPEYTYFKWNPYHPLKTELFTKEYNVNSMKQTYKSF